MDFGNPTTSYLRCPACSKTALKVVYAGVWDGRAADGTPAFGSFRFARCLRCAVKYGYHGPHTATFTMHPMTDEEWAEQTGRWTP